MIFLIEKIISNIANMFLYLFLGAPSSNSIFLMAYLFNSTDNSGGNKIEEQNGFMILVFFIFNLLFEGLIFFNTDRTQRVKAVLVLSIIFTIYNFFKQFGIILRIFTIGKKLEDNCKDKNNVLDIWKKNRELKGIMGEKNNNNNEDEGMQKVNDENNNVINRSLENQSNNLKDINNNRNNPSINNFEEEQNRNENKNDENNNNRDSFDDN